MSLDTAQCREQRTSLGRLGGKGATAADNADYRRDDSACVRPVERRAASHAASGASVSACHQLAGGSYGEASLGCRSCGALMVADTRRLGAKMRTAASQPVGALYTCRAERFDFWPDNAMNQLLAAYGTELALARSHKPITLMRHDV